MTGDEFIALSNDLHNNRYDYSKVAYVNKTIKVEIICPTHGSFWQTPKTHLRGHGCRFCSYGSLEKFLEKARAAHGDRYDYSETVYKGSTSKLMIRCREHGLFEQTVDAHVRGSGCKKCAAVLMNQKMSSNTAAWIDKAHAVHGDMFDYSKVDYVRATGKIIIICREHGPFEQRAHSHLEGVGCPYCAGVIRTTERFIERAAIKQPAGRFTYEHTHYVNSLTPIVVTCVDHGPFTTSPSEHIRGANGCVRCQGSSPEQKWLDSLNVDNRQVRITLPEGYVVVDGIDEKTNTIYEFHGDYWHGNPAIYRPEEMNRVRNMTYGQLYELTLDREQRIRDAGYTLVTMWEKDWRDINPR